MTFKRGNSRLPIPPKDAKVQNVTCDFCIVGCGYKAYSWSIDREGGTKPGDNAFGVDLNEQAGALAESWYNPAMHNIVQQNGEAKHLIIKPDQECSVNGGLNSVRGGRMAESRFSAQTGSMSDRLTTPKVWKYSQMLPASWDDALSLTADVTRRVIDEMGEDGILVTMFDHGGAAGGYENTWGTGKLYFEAMKVKNCRIHNRPAYNSEVHATRDMGMGELNNAYEDAQLADTIFVVGANPLETQTNYFLNHWVPNMNGGSLDKKNEMLPGEEHASAKIIIVDPRRTVTINACEKEAGKENVLHLAINPGTDLVLLNALMTEIVFRGWQAKDFIVKNTSGFDDALAENQISVDEASQMTGLSANDIRKAARWIAEPKSGGKRRRTMMAYEKGLIWTNDNYRTNSAIANLAFATESVGREGTGCVRLGGHQEGYMRPSDAFIGRPAPNIDDLILSGKGGIHFTWATDTFKSGLNASKYRREYRRRTNIVKEAMASIPYGDREAQLDAIMNAIRRGGLFSVDVDILPSQIGEAAHVVLPAATTGEMNLTSMNGERRLRLSEKYMDAPGEAIPDCLIAARLANALEASFRSVGNDAWANKFKGFDWKTEEDAFMDGYNKNASGGKFVTYDRLRAMGTNGVQEPVVGYENGKLIGTKRLYTDGQFGGKDNKAMFFKSKWRGYQPSDRGEQKTKFPFLINSGRKNMIWQNSFYDERLPFVWERFKMPPIEMNPDDMKKLGLEKGDLVEVFNDVGSTQAMVYPLKSEKQGQCFMIFAAPMGQHGNIVSKGVNELRIPNYKNVWANIRKIGKAPEADSVSFKELGYPLEI